MDKQKESNMMEDFNHLVGWILKGRTYNKDDCNLAQMSGCIDHGLKKILLDNNIREEDENYQKAIQTIKNLEKFVKNFSLMNSSLRKIGIHPDGLAAEINNSDFTIEKYMEYVTRKLGADEIVAEDADVLACKNFAKIENIEIPENKGNLIDKIIAMLKAFFEGKINFKNLNKLGEDDSKQLAKLHYRNEALKQLNELKEIFTNLTKNKIGECSQEAENIKDKIIENEVRRFHNDPKKIIEIIQQIKLLTRIVRLEIILK